MKYCKAVVMQFSILRHDFVANVSRFLAVFCNQRHEATLVLGCW